MAAPLIDQGIEHIRDLIVRGVLQPGSQLPPEQELADMLGCSRNTTREAVRSLVMAKVLDVRRGDGTYVTSLEPQLLLEGIGFAVDLIRDEHLLELWEIRRDLEPAATASAALRLTDDELDHLGDILEHMGASMADEAGLFRHDAAFHDLIIRAAGNQTRAALLGSLSARTTRARVWRGVRDKGVNAVTVAQHAQILDALRARDPEMAHAAALTHVATGERWFHQLVPPLDSEWLPVRDAGRVPVGAHRRVSGGSSS